MLNSIDKFIGNDLDHSLSKAYASTIQNKLKALINTLETFNKFTRNIGIYDCLENLVKYFIVY